MVRAIVISAGFVLGSWSVCAYPRKGEVDTRQVRGKCDIPVVLDAGKNVWLNFTLHPNRYYRNQVLAAAEAIDVTDSKLKKRSLVVANSGSFLWIESKEDVSKIEDAAKDVPCDQILGIVVSGLTADGCDTATGHSPTRRDAGNYVADFTAPIARQIKANPNTAFALIIEPGILPFVVRNPYLKTCETAQKTYFDNIPSALKLFDLPNSITYLDAAHGGFFGWTRGTYKDSNERLNSPRDITSHLHQIWLAAGGPSLKQFRGIATNVKSYNSWDLSPGEAFQDETTVCADLFNRARNEQQYLRILKDEFKRINSSMPVHAIMDVTRNTNSGIRQYWHDWCNVNHASFGRVPSLELTKYIHEKNSNFDTLVWATPAGFSDGTSDERSASYKLNCTGPAALQPMPEKNAWSQAYFEMMLRETRWDPYLVGSRNVDESRQFSWKRSDDTDVQHEGLVRRCDG
ncbi:1, 4-beta cellobiohydrolase [Lophiotrema nucula]|uniref:1, 4-beta cellobiohydrolase n=1 Tax=Lophiotrema nucula TaxID=690887 RepID=A0A6A5ZR35_9PLEO|nr:1, 4-beta cellobiohydrolase [Lophiotrema nucula]